MPQRVINGDTGLLCHFLETLMIIGPWKKVEHILLSTRAGLNVHVNMVYALIDFQG